MSMRVAFEGNIKGDDKMKHKRKILLGTLIAVLTLSMVYGTALGGNGNPVPGYPHDTIIFSIQCSNRPFQTYSYMCNVL